jgi:hypothetical protein
MRKRKRAYVKWEEVQTSRRHTEFNKHDRQLLAQLARAGEDDRLAEQPISTRLPRVPQSVQKFEGNRLDVVPKAYPRSTHSAPLIHI